MGVVNLPSGRPTMKLTGGALTRLQAITPQGHEARIDLTITDECPMAQAFVMISAVPVGERLSDHAMPRCELELRSAAPTVLLHDSLATASAAPSRWAVLGSQLLKTAQISRLTRLVRPTCSAAFVARCRPSGYKGAGRQPKDERR